MVERSTISLGGFMDTVTIQKRVPVVASYDVVVCGGGPSGLMAAISASREGAKTAIIEQYGFFGGMATSGFVTPMSVFSYGNKRNIGGIPWEFVLRLEKMGGACIEHPLNNVAFDIELYKLCAQRMINEAGVDIYVHSFISSVVKAESNRITEVVFENKNGSEAVQGKVFIDCTGDADIAFMSGVPMEKENEKDLQPASLCFVLSGVDTQSDLIKECMHHHLQAVNCQCEPIRKKLLIESEKWNLPSFGGPWFCTVLHEGSVAVNMTRSSANPCDNRQFVHAEEKMREDVFFFTRILKENFEEFRNCYVSSIAPQAGARESRHIQGMHMITAEEYLTAFRYEDSISRCAHPIDIHSTETGKQECKFLDKAAYVPYRSLVPKHHPNLLVAGKSLSASKEAFASLRVQASCMGMGQAAGVAAAMCVQKAKDVQDIDGKRLGERLSQMGAILD
jgi:hypothetical protein